MSYPADVLVSVRGEARRTVPPDRADIAGTTAVTGDLRRTRRGQPLRHWIA